MNLLFDASEPRIEALSGVDAGLEPREPLVDLPLAFSTAAEQIENRVWARGVRQVRVALQPDQIEDAAASRAKRYVFAVAAFEDQIAFLDQNAGPLNAISSSLLQQV